MKLIVVVLFFSICNGLDDVNVENENEMMCDWNENGNMNENEMMCDWNENENVNENEMMCDWNANFENKCIINNCISREEFEYYLKLLKNESESDNENVHIINRYDIIDKAATAVYKFAKSTIKNFKDLQFNFESIIQLISSFAGLIITCFLYVFAWILVASDIII